MATLPVRLYSENAATSMLNMREPNTRFDQIDLKTLRMLSALLDTASVTRSGEVLGLSQPAASRAVERLRRALDDPLLVRTSKGYSLTARAEALKPLVADALAALERMFERDGFDPAAARRTFRIGATDYGSVTVLSRLAAQVAREAPGVCLDVVPFGPNTFSDLESGALDCALDADADLPPDFHYRELFQDDYACLVRREHPCLSMQGDILERIAVWPQAIMMYPEGGRMLPDEVLRELGVVSAGTTLRTPYFMSMPWIIAETDLVICVPRRVAERLANVAGLEVLLLPNSPSFSYRLIWHERVHRDPGMRWIRNLSNI
ncbi:LysR family transcriptional regulator [Bradyrhizobium sp. S3.3.6]|uniref:LysR family transcriptional regulator n=1 Tax=Bradyrhizobium sp. S3.3.6 TaxID=3156429 RepID=UPI0033946E4B